MILQIMDIEEKTSWYFDPMYIHDCRRGIPHVAELDMIQ